MSVRTHTHVAHRGATQTLCGRPCGFHHQLKTAYRQPGESAEGMRDRGASCPRCLAALKTRERRRV